MIIWKGSLFAAFAVIAGMAIVISAGAGMVLGHLGGAMVELSGRDIPRLAASLQLSEQSASLASQGPALLASRSQEALNERSAKMKETQTVALQKLTFENWRVGKTRISEGACHRSE